ncbi:MAG: hypothetical protein ABSB56_02350 [Nitrososphaerales archaeon]
MIAVAVTAIFYFYIEGVMGKAYKGLSNYLARGHLILMNVGAAGAMFIMMWGGYMAGWALASASSGGAGPSALQVHEQYLGQTVDPIGAFILLACIGALMGGLGYTIRSRAQWVLLPSSFHTNPSRAKPITILRTAQPSRAALPTEKRSFRAWKSWPKPMTTTGALRVQEGK